MRRTHRAASGIGKEPFGDVAQATTRPRHFERCRRSRGGQRGRASRALRNPDVVSPRLRARVGAAVPELAYVPNEHARRSPPRAPAGSRVMVPRLPTASSTTSAGAPRRVRSHGLPGFRAEFQGVPGREEKAIATALGQYPEAVVLAGVEQTPQARHLLRQAGVPIVQTMEITDAPIDVEHRPSHPDAGYAAARYLFELRHRKAPSHGAARFPARKRADGYRRPRESSAATDSRGGRRAVERGDREDCSSK